MRDSIQKPGGTPPRYSTSQHKGRLSPLRVALLYALFATIWILTSDGLLQRLVDDPTLINRFSMAKGLVFVGVSTLLLYLLLRVWREPVAPDKHQTSLNKPPRARIPLPAIFILLFGLVPLVGISVVKLHGPAMERDAQRNLEAIALLKARQVESWLREREGDGQVFMRSPMFIELLGQWQATGDPVIGENLRERLRSVQQAYGVHGFEQVFLVNAEGRPVINADEHSTLWPQREQLLETALATRRITHSDIYTDQQGGLHLDFVVPLFNRANEAVGGVVMHINPRRFLYANLAEWPMFSESGNSVLLVEREDGVEILHSSELSYSPTLLLQGYLDLIEQNDSEQASTYPLQDREGRQLLAGLAPIHNTNWVIVSTQERGEVLAPLHSLSLWASLISFFTVVVISAALLLLWQYQRRIHRLALKSQADEIGHMLQYFYDLPLMGMAVLSLPERHWLHFNDCLSQTLGYSREALQEKPWKDLLCTEEQERDGQALARLLEGKQNGYQHELRLRHQNGEVLHLMVNMQLVRSDNQQDDFLIATLQDISELKRQEQTLQHQRDLYNTISHTNQAIVRCKHRDELFEDICRIAVQYGHFSFVRILRIAEDSQHAQIMSEEQSELASGDLSSLSFHPDNVHEEGPLRQLFLSGRTVVINDIQNDPSLASGQHNATQQQVKAMALVPIHRHGEIYGCMNLYAGKRDLFDQEMMFTLHEMAMDIGFALDNFARAMALETANQVVESSPVVLFRWRAKEGWPLEYVSENVRRWGYSAEALLERPGAYEEMIHPDDRARVNKEVAQRVGEGMNAYHQTYRLLNADGGILWVEDKTNLVRDKQGKLIAYNGMVSNITERKEAEERFRVLVEQSLVGILMLDDHHIHYANPRAEQIFAYPENSSHGMHIQEWIQPSERNAMLLEISELLNGDRSGGQIQFHGLRKDGSSVMIGAHISHATIDGKPMLIGMLQDITDKLETEQQIQTYLKQLENAMEGTVQAVSYMVELRDPYTSGHERRVGEIATAIAAEMGLDETIQRSLQVIGGLHDVGKITVPAEILSKPGRLTSMEFEIIKAHAEQGYEILKNISFPWPVAKAVLQHHERMDGSGYPHGLKGDEIILEARIISVADVMESMASHRPYRPGIGVDIALEEIERGAGKEYDAEVAAACLRLFRDKAYEIPA